MRLYRNAMIAAGALLLFGLAAPALHADTITANIIVNTSGLAADLGDNPSDMFELFFQLNDGGGSPSDLNTLVLNDFSFGTGGSAGSIDTMNSSGDYSGDLSSGITMDDAADVYNYVAVFFTPGSELDFTMADTYTGIDSSPDGFSFAIIENGAPLDTSDPTGDGNLVAFTFDGTSPPTVYSDTADGIGTPGVNLEGTVPEPPSLWLWAGALAMLGLASARRRRTA